MRLHSACLPPIVLCCLVSCSGRSAGTCPLPTGCAEDTPCCSASTACTERVCQGIGWVCEPVGDGHAWVRQPSQSGACSQPPPDLGGDAPSPDGSTPDLDGPPPPPDAGQDTLSPDGPASGTCESGDVSFEVVGTLTDCTAGKLIARSVTPYAWIAGGVEAPSGARAWDTGPQIEGDGDRAKWTFSFTVPCEPGPYKLLFMENATNGDVTKGKIVASCTP